MEAAHKNGYHKTCSSKLSRGPSLKFLIMKSFSRIWPVLVIFLMLLTWNLWVLYGKDLKVQVSRNLDLTKTSQELYTKIKTLECLLPPVAWGLAFTFFSWSVIYLDSNHPGMDPPLPISRKGLNFHLQYATSLYVATLVSMKLIYDRWEYEPTLV